VPPAGWPRSDLIEANISLSCLSIRKIRQPRMPWSMGIRTGRKSCSRVATLGAHTTSIPPPAAIVSRARRVTLASFDGCRSKTASDLASASLSSLT
jgi:hypothetical protein